MNFQDNISLEIDKRKIQDLIDNGTITEDEVINAEIEDE